MDTSVAADNLLICSPGSRHISLPDEGYRVAEGRQVGLEEEG